MVSISNAKQVLNLFTHTAGQSFVQRPNVVRVLASDLKYVLPTEGDVFVKTTKQIAETLIKADKKLFSWVKPKPTFSMREVNPESLVMVHRTNYFPEGGRILSTSAATKNAEGVAAYRPTVHFSLNKSVTEHWAGNEWNSMDYSIVLPFKETVELMPKSKVIGGIQDDFFFIDSVKLPKGSIIIKRNSDIAKDQLKVSEIFDGVRLVETSTDDMVKTTDLIIEKMGYTPYNKALQKYLGATDKEMKVLTSMPEEQFMQMSENIAGEYEAKRTQIKEFLENMKEWEDVYEPDVYKNIMENQKQTLELCNLAEKYAQKMKDFPNAWQRFCKEYNYYQGLHQGTSWANTEWFLQGLDILSKGSKESWIWNGTDYTEQLLKVLNGIKTKLPPNKDLGYDIDKLISIVKNSKNPELAQKEVIQKLKLKTIKPSDTSINYRLEDLGIVGEQEMQNEANELALLTVLGMV